MPDRRYCDTVKCDKCGQSVFECVPYYIEGAIRVEWFCSACFPPTARITSKKGTDMPPKEKKGLKALEGENVELWCGDCAYKGLLVEVEKKDVTLRDAMYSAEKGPKPVWEDLPSTDWGVRVDAIESYGLSA